jgi:hypothetical protein
VSFVANRTVTLLTKPSPIAVAVLLAKGTVADLTAFSFHQQIEHVVVGEAFPTGPAFLLAKSSFPSLKTPTVLSQQELGSLVGKAFANRIGVFANSLVDRE